jgi:hypothetical protein
VKKIAFKLVDGKINFLAIPQIQKKLGILTTNQKRFAFVFDENDCVDTSDFEVVDSNFDFNALRERGKKKILGETVLDFLVKLNIDAWWSSPKNMAKTKEVERVAIIDGKSISLKENVTMTSGVDKNGKSIMVESLNSKVFERMSISDLRRMCDENQVLFNGETVAADELADFHVFSIIFFPRNERFRNTVL